MNTPLDQFDDSVEAQLSRLQPRAAVGGLREATLGRVQQELRSSRWDRRLGRVAAVLLVVGIGMNAATVNKRPLAPTSGQVAAPPTTASKGTTPEKPGGTEEPRKAKEAAGCPGPQV